MIQKDPHRYIRRIELALVDNLIWVILLGAIIASGVMLGTRFLSLSTLKFIVYSSAKSGLIVFAAAVCLLSGNFDLSVGQMTGFLAMANAMLLTVWVPGLSWLLGIITILAMGATCGALNGFFVGKLRLNPFLVTLGTYMVFYGGTLMISLHTISVGFPPEYLAVGGGSIGPVPIALIVFMSVALLLHFMLKNTRFGSNLLSVGGNADSARMAGIKTGNVVFWTYVLSGVLCGIAGLLYTGYLGAATPGLADGTLFMACAGAVIGGISLAGGRGSIIGAMGGILLIGVVEASLTMLRIPPEEVQVFFGALVIVAILVNMFQRRMRDKILVPS